MKSIGKKILVMTTLFSMLSLFAAGCDWDHDHYGYYGHDDYRAGERYGYDRGEAYYPDGRYYSYDHDWDRDHGDHDWDHEHDHGEDD